MITKHEYLSNGRDVSNISPPTPATTAVAAVERKSNVFGSIPSDHATAAPTLVATINQRRAGNNRQRYKQSAWAPPSIAPSTDPASTMATRVANGPQDAPVTATPTAAGTLMPTASPSVTTSTHRIRRMTILQVD